MIIKDWYNRIDKEIKYGLLVGLIISLAVLFASINF